MSTDDHVEHATPTKHNSETDTDGGNASHQKQKQIISLGAGSDTRYFRLKRDRKHTGFTYHELDFLENNRAKISRLKDPRCIDLVKRECEVDLDAVDADTNNGKLSSEEYSIHAVDLRELPENLPWLDTNASTLIISECCLIYLSPEAADNVLNYFSHQFGEAPLAVAIYEPFRPGDSFGQTMIRNLMTRGIVLKTIEKYADPEKQRERLRQLGMEARAKDCEDIWRGWVSAEEKERVDRLEWMDEIEEFVLLVKHYCVAWGWRRFTDNAVWRALDGSVS